MESALRKFAQVPGKRGVRNITLSFDDRPRFDYPRRNRDLGGQVGVLGIHHVTALASEPQRNVNFYAGLLGMRLVKQTVNFDAPDVYHLYYGDETGRPGTILTFFPFPQAVRGRRGSGEISAVAFSIPPGSAGYWGAHLARRGIPLVGPGTRFGESVLSFEDPDGMVVELVEDPSAGTGRGWSGGQVDAAHAIRRLHGVTMLHGSLAPTEAFLTAALEFTAAGSDGGRHRFLAGSGPDQARVDVVVDNPAPAARQSAGSVHHIAWRVQDDAEQLEWRPRLRRAGTTPTQVMDRRYFHSIYFREPGGVLFEIATDPPGFLVDEALGSLGTSLKLPPWLEPQRELIQRNLPPLSLPEASAGTAPREEAS
jgi:glyoxalase family protein